MSQLIVATFPSPRPAELATEVLFNDGCTQEQVHIVAGASSGHSYQDDDRKQSDAIEIAGIALIIASTTIIPGIGFLLTAIPATAALAATIPRHPNEPANIELLDALRQAGIPEADLASHEHEIRQGRTLLTVAADDDKVSAIASALRHNGAHDLTYILRH